MGGGHKLVSLAGQWRHLGRFGGLCGRSGGSTPYFGYLAGLAAHGLHMCNILGRGSPDIASREFTALLARHPVVILKSIPKLMLLDGDAGGFEAAKAYQFGTKKQAYQVDMNAPQAQLISVRLRS
ncbi:hypothetical protein PSTT_12342 [Puccinia striiformis]|uniref:Topoisomerase 6 subunit A/Spo11 TOPRIM domain-containing protein n=1 Tax=Puccinia striiformis TaxID=27350 RepID=A0A2S4UWK4_9BASI|nr:hypothetical protein PSTT_12342 [Puccinia striiformis]